MSGAIDHLTFLQLELGTVRAVLQRPHDQGEPLGPQITDDDTRQAIRDYFAEVDPNLDNDTIEVALHEVKAYRDLNIAVASLIPRLFSNIGSIGP